MDDALVSFKLDKDVLTKLQVEAERADVAIADIVRDAIRRDLRRRKLMNTTDRDGQGRNHDWLLSRIKGADPSRA